MAAIQGRHFLNVLTWGGVRTFAPVGKMAGMGAKFFGLHTVDELLTKTFLNAWKSVKVCCPRDDCVSKRLLFCHEGLNLITISAGNIPECRVAKNSEGTETIY